MAGGFVNRNAFGRALGQERLAVRFDPGLALYHKKLACILTGGDPRGEIAEFETVNRLEPDLASNNCDLGSTYESADPLARAAEERKRALELQRRYREALAGLRARGAFTRVGYYLPL